MLACHVAERRLVLDGTRIHRLSDTRAYDAGASERSIAGRPSSTVCRIIGLARLLLLTRSIMLDEMLNPYGRAGAS